jgi:hypothetical protein
LAFMALTVSSSACLALSSLSTSACRLATFWPSSLFWALLLASSCSSQSSSACAMHSGSTRRSLTNT